jgi:uronate dehydrogenase
MERCLITGAAGGIGTRLRRLLKGVYPVLRLSDRVRPADLAADEEFVAADLTEPAAVDRAVAGMQGIIHLGGVSVERPWDEILPANIVGIYNLFEAARKAGVERVVFASSNHILGFYPRHRRLGTAVIPRPDSRYGVSKVFGEALGALYADKYGLRVLTIRIGNVNDKPIDVRRLSIWILPEDLVQLIRIGLEHPDLHYEVVYGVSDNVRGWWDNETAYRLGYRPTGQSERWSTDALAAQAKLPPDPVGDRLQGGTFCSLEYAGDPDRIKDGYKP